MSSEETRLWNIQSNLYFHVPMPKVPVPKVPVAKVPVQNSNINLSIWQTSSDCDPLSIGSWVTQLWCLATQNPSPQTGMGFLATFPQPSLGKTLEPPTYSRWSVKIAIMAMLMTVKKMMEITTGYFCRATSTGSSKTKWGRWGEKITEQKLNASCKTKPD